MNRTRCRIVESPIETELTQCMHEVDPAHGAEVSFIGRVRNHNQGQEVDSVSYDAYIPLAEKVFLEICGEAQKKWGTDLGCLILHRVGRVQVGEASIVIRVTSRHRDESYLASRYIIEEVKTRAPVWKKEHYLNGETDWVRGHALCAHAERHP